MMRPRYFFVLLLATVLASCGRDVTPAVGDGSILSGQMLVRFRTQAPLNFGLYQYVIAFNTSGNGQTPYANPAATSYQNTTFAWIVTARNGVTVAPALYQVLLVSNGLSLLPVSVPPQDVTFVQNSNGQGNEFSLQFSRALFYTNITNGVGGGANALPSPIATTPGQATWNMNVYSMTQNNVVLDAGGSNPYDTSFPLSVPTNAFVDNTLPFRKAGAQQPASPQAQIVGGEIINNP